jgi:hypothetical protein
MWARPEPIVRSSVADLRRSKSAGPSRGSSPSNLRESRPKSAVDLSKSPDRKLLRPNSAVGQNLSPERAIDRHQVTIRVYQKATEKTIPRTLATTKTMER